MRIVYVEDNQANVFLLKRIANAGQHEFVNYIDAESALANLADDQPHILFVDMQLAGKMHGLEFVQKVRAAGYAMPIVAITAYANPEEREFYLESGCDEFIIKPAPVNKLVELLQ